MTTELVIDITGAVLRNGRIYFSAADAAFFPADSLGDRARDGHKGQSVRFIAGTRVHDTDIRVSSGRRLSPRASFGAYLKAIRATEGERLRVTRTAEREYRVEPCI
jgi:hypothetical protein